MDYIEAVKTLNRINEIILELKWIREDCKGEFSGYAYYEKLGFLKEDERLNDIRLDKKMYKNIRELMEELYKNITS